MGFKVVFETFAWWWSSNDKRYLVPDLWSCRGEGLTAEFSLIFILGTFRRYWLVKQSRRLERGRRLDWLSRLISYHRSSRLLCLSCC